MERLKHGFESPTQRFGSLNLKLWRTSQGDSNLRVMDSNPFSNWSWKLKVRQTKRFESSSYKFESHLSAKFKFYKSDLNHLHSNSNPSWRINEEIEAWIWIPYTTIRIPKSGVMKNKSRRFKSSSYRLIPSQIEAEGWRSDRAIRIFKLRIRITHWHKIQILERRFE